MLSLVVALIAMQATPMPPEPIHGTFAGFNTFANNEQNKKHKKRHRDKHAPVRKKTP